MNPAVIWFLVLAAAVIAAAVRLSIVISTPSNEEEAIKILMSDGKEWTGLDLVKASNGALTRGRIYISLMAMEDKGLVTYRTLENGRCLYKLTV